MQFVRLQSNRSAHRATIVRAASLAAALALSPLFGFEKSAMAASDTWSGLAADGQFATPGNWIGLNVPGVANGTYVSPDVATINGGPPADLSLASIAVTTISIDTNRNLAGITFDAINTQPFTVGTSAGPILRLTGGGTTQTTANFVNNSTNATPPIVYAGISAPISISGNTYTFAANSPSTASGTVPGTGLRISGPISFSGTGPSNLNLSGTHFAGVNTSNDQLAAPLADSGGGSVGVTKSGPGVWEINPTTATNSYSGDTVINGGLLRIRGVIDPLTGATTASGASPNSNYIINAGGALRFSDTLTVNAVPTAADHVTRSITINSGGTLDVSSSAVNYIKVANNNGPGLTLNYTDAVTPGANQQFDRFMQYTGTTPDQGGIRLRNGGAAIGTVNLSNTTRAINLGTVRRPIDVDSSTANVSAGTFDLRLRGPITGSGGILKLGAGWLALENAASPITGNIEVRDGRLSINNSNALTGQPSLIISGGSLTVTGSQTHTFSSVNVTKGLISASSSATSTILTNSVTFDVANGDTGTIGTIIGNISAPATVLKKGLGTGVMGGTNTYTGPTTIEAGALRLTGPARTAFTGGATTPYADIKGGRLQIDYTAGTSPQSTIVPILAANAPTLFASGLVRSSNATATRGLGWADDTTTSLFTVAATYNGDINLDGQVTSTDFSAFVTGYGKTNGSIWADGDFNYDGKVNTGDFNSLAGNFGATPLPGGLPSGSASLGSVVPEPGTMSVVILAAGGLLAKRRRK